MARVLDSALAGVLALGLARLASAQDGPAGARPTATSAPPSASATARATPARLGVPVDQALRLDEYLKRLDEWRTQGRITPTEAARARRALYAAVVARDTTALVPLDANGRIDLLALARGRSDATDTATRHDERLAARVVNEFDLRMRMKPRDLANHGSLPMFDAAPGYVRVPAGDLSRIVKTALETTPLGELPGSGRLIDFISALPNVSGAKPEHTVKELSRLVGDRQEDWFRSRAGRLIDGRELEAGLLAFGVITGLRRASPATARAVDRFGLRLRLARWSLPDARLYSTSRLLYRNGHALPALEVESGARHTAGSMTLRAVGAATVGVEASHDSRGRVAIGARWERGPWSVETNVLHAFPDRRTRAEWRSGYITETGFAVSGAVVAAFGADSGAVGRAAGRMGYEVDLTTVVAAGHARGEAGLFITSSADSNFAHADSRAGLIFRMRF